MNLNTISFWPALVGKVNKAPWRKKEQKRERGLKQVPSQKKQNPKWVTKGQRNELCSRSHTRSKSAKERDGKLERAISLTKPSPATKALLFIQNIRCNKRTSNYSLLLFSVCPLKEQFQVKRVNANREANQNIFALVQPIFEVRWWALWVWWASPHLGGNGGTHQKEQARAHSNSKWVAKNFKTFCIKTLNSTIWARKVQIVSTHEKVPFLLCIKDIAKHSYEESSTYIQIDQLQTQTSTGMKDMGNRVYYSSRSGTYHWKSINMSWGRGVLVMKKQILWSIFIWFGALLSFKCHTLVGDQITLHVI